MGCRRSDLQEAFFVAGTHAFRVWGYGTTDPLEEVLAPGYFAPAGGRLRPGELIYVSTAPRPGRPGEPAQGEVRLALVMVRSDPQAPDRADGVRLVQDFGRPSDPPAALAPAAPAAPAGAPAGAPAPLKRGRGRPPGSKTRKPAPDIPAPIP